MDRKLEECCASSTLSLFLTLLYSPILYSSLIRLRNDQEIERNCNTTQSSLKKAQKFEFYTFLKKYVTKRSFFLIKIKLNLKKYVTIFKKLLRKIENLI